MEKRIIREFDGTDYDAWNTRMRIILQERKLIKYLEPRESINNYDAEDDMNALSEIQLALNNEQLKLVMDCRTAHDAWEKLHKRATKTSVTNLVLLKNQLYTL